MPSYDGTSPAEGKSKEIDAIARGAAVNFQHNKDAAVNTEDPANSHRATVQGNPDDPAYSRKRTVGGQGAGI